MRTFNPKKNHRQFSIRYILIGLSLGFCLISSGIFTMAQAKELTVRPFQTVKPTIAYEVTAPIIDCLNKSLAAKKIDITLKIIQSKVEAKVDEENRFTNFIKGEEDFAIGNYSHYLVTKAKSPKIQLAGCAVKDGKKEVYSVVFTNKKSGLTKIEDVLKYSGDERKSLLRATEKLTATPGYLAQHGITEKNFKKTDSAPQIDQAIALVASGEFDVAGSNLPMFKQNENKGLGLVQIGEYVVPSIAFMARAGLDAKTLKSVSSALANLPSSCFDEVKKVNPVDGFTQCDDSAYKIGRDLMKSAEKFWDVTGTGK